MAFPLAQRSTTSWLLRALVLGVGVALAGSWPFGAAPFGQSRQLSGGAAPAPSAPPFVDRTGEVGFDFVHENGAAGELLLPEVIGSGGAVFDFDNDGDLDVFAVQSGHVRGAASADRRARSRLYRNDLVSGRVRLVDVTDASGIATTGYGMGAAVGDIDNDGWADLYVTSLGPNQMFRNNGDGTFRDVTAASGTNDARWSASASFLDYDRDGWLDLFVANYVNFTPEMKRACFSAGSARDYCNPAVYDPVPDRLFHNNGNGTFSDVSVRSGIARASARGLGVLATDANDDGWTDIVVANDGDPNHLWVNDGGRGTFSEGGLLAGVAVSRTGQAQGSMGLDVGDVDGDGDDDLFVTNLDNEGPTLYRNVGKGLYEDRTVESGLLRLGFTGFGTRFIDFDLDGWLDVVVANGAVRQMAKQRERGDAYPLKQRNQVWRNDGGRRFVDVSDRAGSAFAEPRVGRGMAAGDLDNDGDTDLVVFNNNGPAQVLMGDARGPWVGVRVVDLARRRDALQAEVTLVGPTERRQHRTVAVDGSYGTSSDPRVVFGLGESRGPHTVRVRWPGGRVEVFSGLSSNRYWLLESGRAPRAL